MKPTFTLMLLFAFSFFARNTNAQKIRFTDPRNHWVTSGSYFDCPHFNSFYHFGADTLIHGHTYRRMITSTIYDFSCSGGSMSLYNSFIREDTTLGVVYYVHFSSDGDTAEHVLYDYNMNVGDSMTYFTAFNPVVVVTHIDSTIISGVSHKVISMENKPGYGVAYYTIIEGLGCISSPLFPAYFGACFEYEEKDICFSQDTVYPLTNIPYNHICAGTVLDTFRNSFNCSVLDVSQTHVPLNQISIIPNPVKEKMTIESDVTIPVNIRITDIVGTWVYNTKANRKTVISTSNWADGSYIVLIQDITGKILKRELIVVSH